VSEFVTHRPVESADYYAYKGLVQGCFFKVFDSYMRLDPSYSILPFLRYLDTDQIDGFAYSFVPTDKAKVPKITPKITYFAQLQKCTLLLFSLETKDGARDRQWLYFVLYRLIR
jgi:hypothetical protein